MLTDFDRRGESGLNGVKKPRAVPGLLAQALTRDVEPPDRYQAIASFQYRRQPELVRKPQRAAVVQWKART